MYSKYVYSDTPQHMSEVAEVSCPKGRESLLYSAFHMTNVTFREGNCSFTPQLVVVRYTCSPWETDKIMTVLITGHSEHHSLTLASSCSLAVSHPGTITVLPCLASDQTGSDF